MLVPNKATHKANAEQLIDYYYEPKVAAELAAYVNYICPVAGRAGRDAEDRPRPRREPADLPGRGDCSAKTKVFMALTEAQERTYDQKFQQVIGA